MKKIKRTFLYLFGAILSFVFGQNKVFAQGEVRSIYSVEPIFIGPTLLKRISSIIFSPIFIIIFVLALIIGVIVLIKRKRKNAKKNS